MEFFYWAFIIVVELKFSALEKINIYEKLQPLLNGLKYLFHFCDGKN